MRGNRGLVAVAMALVLSTGVAGAQGEATCGVVDAGQMAYPLDLGLYREVPRSVALSADGSTIAFASPGLGAVIVRDVATGAETLISAPAGDVATLPSLSGDGRRLAFTSLTQVCGRGGCAFLSKAYLAEVATGASQEVTPGHWSNVAQLSEDGRSLVFGTGLEGQFQSDSVVVRALDSGRERVVVRHLRGWGRRPPSVSAHGGKVAYTADATPARPAQVQLYRVATGRTERLTDTLTYASSQPRWLSDGQRLTFASRADIAGANPQHDLRTYLYDLRTGSITALPRLGEDAVLSGNGQRIAYTSSANPDGANPEGNPEVFVLDRRTGATTQLTSTVDGTPSVVATSRDGRRVAFVATVDDEAFTMDLAVAEVCPTP